MKIVPATEANLPAINALIARSKSHWDWPKAYLEAALPLLRRSEEYLQSNLCFEVLDMEEGLVAFLAVAQDDGRIVLDHLWVEPRLIGNGIGRKACEHVFALARQKGWKELYVLPEPNAERFYVKVGFADTGERVPSRVPGGPVFSVYHIRFGDEGQSPIGTES